MLTPRVPDSGDGTTLDHLAFAVPDGEVLDEWARRLTDAGIEHPGIIFELGKPSLQLRDPDGISIELVAPRPRPRPRPRLILNPHRASGRTGAYTRLL